VLTRPTIFLFDIDGTILLTGGAGRRAFAHAFQVVTGRSDAVTSFSFEGMTDRSIARRGLQELGREPDEATFDQLVDTYLIALEAELRDPKGYVVMPSVREVVAELSALEHAAVGLGTGNVRRGAQAKLEYADLWRPFKFGGFGCDHEDRTELLRAGAARGAQQLGLPVEACRVVVIGDTIRDVAAAHGIGAACLAVCTGGGTPEVLRAAGADAVFQDLSQAGVGDFLLGR
jgi:phosphoglycolate phosphatase